jgi:hypothetical protein
MFASPEFRHFLRLTNLYLLTYILIEGSVVNIEYYGHSMYSMSIEYL